MDVCNTLVCVFVCVSVLVTEHKSVFVRQVPYHWTIASTF